MTLSDTIREKALELGFEWAGIAPAGRAPHADDFMRWLDKGYHGDMEWLAREPERRVEPRRVVGDARSMILVGIGYYVADPDPAVWDDPSRGRIARYAWGVDYHDELTPRLEALSDFIRAEGGAPARCRYYVDTGPVLEREWAARAGLGFIGKNSLLIRPDRGSYIFLGCIITNLELDYDEAAADGGATLGKGNCGSCRRCLDICPTHAFPAPYIVDGNRCISYLTIELKESIPESLRSKMGNWIYGCDECQSVCPWVRRYSKPARESFLRYDPDEAAPRLLDLIRMTDEAFRARYRRSPIWRIKRRRFLRNVAVALGNWGDPTARPALERVLSDPEPLIREHAAWALDRLSG